VNLTFTPTSIGAQSGSFIFTDNGSGSPQTVAASGTGAGGPTPTATPSATATPTPTPTPTPHRVVDARARDSLSRALVQKPPVTSIASVGWF
jgi:hypothetical protein